MRSRSPTRSDAASLTRTPVSSRSNTIARSRSGSREPSTARSRAMISGSRRLGTSCSGTRGSGTARSRIRGQVELARDPGPEGLEGAHPAGDAARREASGPRLERKQPTANHRSLKVSPPWPRRPSRSAKRTNSSKLSRYQPIVRGLRPATLSAAKYSSIKARRRTSIKLGTDARPLRLARLQLQVASEQAITDRVAAAHPVGDSVDVAVSGKSSKSLTGRWRLDTTKRRFRLDLS